MNTRSYSEIRNPKSDELAVETVGLTKVFTRAFGRDRVVALDGLDLKVARGRIFGLLGPNGAGKTTLVKILLGISTPTSGAARMLGRDIADVRNRARIGYLPENPRYPAYLSGAQMLHYFGRLSGMERADLPRRIDELLSQVKMDRWHRTKIAKYSKGMIQRLGIAQALVNDPELVFFDEPTDGVDPIGRREIRDIMVDLKRQGKTIFLNSHLLSEVELVCDTVAILNKGRLIRYGSVQELTTDAHRYRMEVDGLSEETERKIESVALFCSKDGRYLDVSVDDVDALNGIIDLLRADRVRIGSIVPQRMSLEDMFVDVIEAEAGG